jgi:hypothetical protein
MTTDHGPAGLRPYNPIPDLARLLRVLEWSAPIGDAPPGSAEEVRQQICQGLGTAGAQTAAEYETLLYRQLATLASGADETRRWEQRFVLSEGVNECADCHMPMVDGVIAHQLDCTGMWPRPALAAMPGNGGASLRRGESPNPLLKRQEDWCFTFGIEHPLRGYYVRLRGTVDGSREQMRAIFGTNWARQYSQADIRPVIERRGLRELELK